MSRSISCTLGKYAQLQEDETVEERKLRLKKVATERRRIRKEARARIDSMGSVWDEPTLIVD